MLRRAYGLIGAKIHAIDGEMGHVDDFYFDDLEWTVRYMIVRTGSWFSEKQVMLSPAVIRDVVWEEEAMYVDLTQDQVKNSPDLDMEKPITREQEMELASYYRWPTYWPAGAVTGIGTMGAPGAGIFPPGAPVADMPGTDVPSEIATDIFSTDISNASLLNQEVSNTAETKTAAELRRAAQAEGLDHYIHGIKEITGYHIAATDGDIGHVDDFFIDEESWQINYLLVETGGWLTGRKVLISPKWITEISWTDSDVRVKATREQVKNSPEYDPHGTGIIDRRYESDLHTHYGFPPYWV
ncbi:MAG: PRC-barrel domain-containing protein [Caldilineaceae bacterium]|nr:PRC-barrel domain-containing protein [Caldilineaceae bacterium]